MIQFGWDFLRWWNFGSLLSRCAYCEVHWSFVNLTDHKLCYAVGWRFMNRLESDFFEENNRHSHISSCILRVFGVFIFELDCKSWLLPHKVMTQPPWCLKRGWPILGWIGGHLRSWAFRNWKNSTDDLWSSHYPKIIYMIKTSLDVKKVRFQSIYKPLIYSITKLAIYRIHKRSMGFTICTSG